MSKYHFIPVLSAAIANCNATMLQSKYLKTLEIFKKSLRKSTSRLGLYLKRTLDAAAFRRSAGMIK